MRTPWNATRAVPWAKATSWNGDCWKLAIPPGAGQWRMVLTEDQINGWFTNNLPREFPDAMPDEIDDPRVAITPDRFQAACRYKSGALETVLSLDLKLYLTDEPRVVAAQLQSVRAGVLPIPPTKVLQPLADAAQAQQRAAAMGANGRRPSRALDTPRASRRPGRKTPDPGTLGAWRRPTRPPRP